MKRSLAAVLAALSCLCAASLAQAQPAPLHVFGGGSHSGNFGQVVIQQHARVTLSGNSQAIVVEPGARLHLSGNTQGVEVWGFADLTGNLGRVVVHPGGTAVLHGVATEVLGPGRVIATRGTVIGGVPVQ